MKKSSCLTLGACLIGIVTLCSNANAASGDVSQNASTNVVTIDTTNNTAAPDLTFNPSTNVAVAGESSATAFQINAYHTAVLNKTSGQSFGMASNSNKVWFDDISGDASYNTPTGTSTANFVTKGWSSI